MEQKIKGKYKAHKTEDLDNPVIGIGHNKVFIGLYPVLDKIIANDHTAKNESQQM
jgi:hypothetical protein